MQTLRFALTLAAGPALLTVLTDGESNTVTACTAPCGAPAETTLADLNLAETAVETARGALSAPFASAATVTALQADDVMTGRTAWFTVEHLDSRPRVVRYADGLTVSYGAPQWTETTEAFFLNLDAERAVAAYAEEEEARHDRFAKL